MSVLLMMNQINIDYYEWLISQVRIPGTRTYNELFERMQNVEFVWTVPNDDNRVQDGLDLRVEFLNELAHISRKERADFERFHTGVTFLEVLIGLSRRVAFTAGGDPDAWAWQLIDNLRLRKASDPFTESKANRVDEILETVIWRTYRRDGQGGFFPLNSSVEDQTKVEIWYQMHNYVNEIQEP